MHACCKMPPGVLAMTACVLFSIPRHVFARCAPATRNHVAVDAIDAVFADIVMRDANTGRVIRYLVAWRDRSAQHHILFLPLLFEVHSEQARMACKMSCACASARADTPVSQTTATTAMTFVVIPVVQGSYGLIDRNGAYFKTAHRDCAAAPQKLFLAFTHVSVIAVHALSEGQTTPHTFGTDFHSDFGTSHNTIARPSYKLIASVSARGFASTL
jgi:hypothetical protein